MNFFQAICFAFVQAATEFLPISSSGHLLLLKGIFRLEEVPVLYDVIIHLGSLGAILFFYHKRIRDTVTDGLMAIHDRDLTSPKFKIISFVFISTCITILFFLFLEDPIQSAFHHPGVLRVTYPILTCILFSTYLLRHRVGEVLQIRNYGFPIVVGFFQAMAIMPGISRSGSTISVSLLLGVKREDGAYYSFLLFIPAVLGALVFQISEVENWQFFSDHILIVFTSFFISAIGGYFFLMLLTYIVKKGSFWVFGFYTLALSILCWILF